ncbi:hypothetical protein BY996DRAFT_6413858 [Phakopsora pachyrhizi]|nr:hypothetical protein BY996DRAFT_6413858 [Phakopsora pachyrhizi]
MIRDEAHCSCEVGATDCRTSCSRVDLTSYSLSLTAYHRQELVTSSSNVSLPGDSKSVADLSQLRPWTRLPPPPMVTSHRKTNLPSLCLYIPVHLPHELSPFQWSPESPVSPQLTPNQLTPPSTCEEEPGRLEIGECRPSLSSRTQRKTSLKKVNKSNEKDRNRCLTCGSSFSTFANLTRHEKKCALVAPKVET